MEFISEKSKTLIWLDLGVMLSIQEDSTKQTEKLIKIQNDFFIQDIKKSWISHTYNGSFKLHPLSGDKSPSIGMHKSSPSPLFKLAHCKNGESSILYCAQSSIVNNTHRCREDLPGVLAFLRYTTPSASKKSVDIGPHHRQGVIDGRKGIPG